jgi:cell division protease FtsH
MSEEKEKKNQFDKVFNKNTPNNNSGGGFNFYWIYAIIALIFIGLQIFNFGSSVRTTTWQEFENKMLKTGDVEKVVVVTNELLAEVYIKRDSLKKAQYERVRTKGFGRAENYGPHFVFNIGSVETFNADLKEAQKDFKPEQKITVTYDPRKNWMGDILSWVLPFVLMIGLWIFIMRRMSGGVGGGGPGQIFNFGKSRATLFDQNTRVNVTFNDVAGLEGAKEEVMEIVDFLKNSKKYTTLGAKIPKGALLVGPPGTGKTLLAKAVAGEARVPFFSLSGSDFVEMFVGVGASRVRDLFRQAKEKAPCIIFIDEIDAIGRARGKNPLHGANDERESTLNQLLTEMDGFTSNSGIIVMAATNRADILDKALLRPGRFDRQIYVDMPELNERKEIFKVHLKPLKLDDTVDIDFLARQTPGFSGADIANLCNEAALIAARRNKNAVSKQDFLDAVDRIIGGLEKKNKIIKPEEKKRIAYHEAGHATVSWLLEHASPLIKVTIVPRGKSLGAAWYLPEERQITTTEQLMDEMCAALGGRAAEEVVFGNISTGALSDLEKITKQAYAMVTIYGLNKKIGNLSFYDSSGQSEFSLSKPYSEKTAELIDEEVKKMIDQAYERTKKIIIENREKLDKLALALLQKEVIFKEDLEEIFGKRKFEKDLQEETEAQKVKEENKTQTETSNTETKAEEQKGSTDAIPPVAPAI